MASFNRVILMGNLTRDVELKYLQSGTAVTEIGLAVNDRRKDAKTGQWVDETTFVDITMWGRTAEIAGEYLSKGSSVLIEGRLKLDQWETDGQKRSKLRVVCENLRMLGGRGERGRWRASRRRSESLRWPRWRHHNTTKANMAASEEATPRRVRRSGQNHGPSSAGRRDSVLKVLRDFQRLIAALAEGGKHGGRRSSQHTNNIG